MIYEDEETYFNTHTGEFRLKDEQLPEAIADDGSIAVADPWGIPDYTQEPMYKLYHDAIAFERKLQREQPLEPGYWGAWYAARRATGALLEEARKVGVTEEQWEALRKVAAHVAAD